MDNLTIEQYLQLTNEEKLYFIKQVNMNISHYQKVQPQYVIKQRKRKTQGMLQMMTHQAEPGRLTAIEELERTDIQDQKTYLLCKCDCGKWHICRSDAYKKETTSNGACFSCGCLNQESLSKNIFNPEVQKRRINKLKEYLSDKGIQPGDEIFGWKITQIKTEPSTTKHGTRKYVKGICPYCHKESHWIRGDGIQAGSVHSCGCASETIGEQRIRQLLELHKIPFHQEYTFENCRSNITGAKFRWDFYVNNKYLIEFDGEQHFQSKGNFFTEEIVQNIKIRDELKNQWCKDNNIPLIRIPYTHLNKICLEDLLLETSDFIYKGDENIE